MKKVFLISLVLLVSLTFEAEGQFFVPEISLGWGEYSMKELKDLSRSINAPVALKTVNSFPPYFFYKAALMFELHAFRFGFSWGHYSTGARDHYRDYSGEISVKQLIHTNVYSFPLYLNTNEKNRLNFLFVLEPGIMATKFVIKQDMRVWDESAHSEYSDEMTHMSFQPGIKLAYTIRKWQPSLNFGYYFDTKFLIKHGDRAILFEKDESKYYDFSGIRFSVSLAYKLGISRNDLRL